MMTREEKLTTMTMACLAEIAKGLGIKIDKKGAKAKAVAKIMEAEAKKADAEEVKEVMKQKKELGIECPKIESVEIVNAGDGTPLAEVGKEIAEQAKEKSKKASKKQSDVKTKISAVEVSEKLQAILSKLAVNFVVGKYSVVLRDADKKKYAEICCNKSGLRIYLKSDAICLDNFGDRALDNPSSTSQFAKIVLVAISEMSEFVSKLVS